jgi:hypothetical protein
MMQGTSLESFIVDSPGSKKRLCPDGRQLPTSSLILVDAIARNALGKIGKVSLRAAHAAPADAPQLTRGDGPSSDQHHGSGPLAAVDQHTNVLDAPLQDLVGQLPVRERTGELHRPDQQGEQAECPAAG